MTLLTLTQLLLFNNYGYTTIPQFLCMKHKQFLKFDVDLQKVTVNVGSNPPKKSKNNGLPKGTIIGISIGIVVIVVAVVITLIIVLKKKKKQEIITSDTDPLSDSTF